MSLSIILKKCVSPNNKLSKSFEDDTSSFSVVLKENTDIFKPTFIIQSNYEIWKYNYIDASDSFERQYFITDIRSVGNERYEIDAKTDVLSTWASQIKSNVAVIKRQQKMYNLYLDDPDFHVLNYEKIQTLQFPTSNEFMKSLQYILVTNGAGNSSQLEKKGGEDNASNSGINLSELS